MAKQILNTGTSNNDKTGDTLRAGGLKIKANFDEIYNALGNGTNITGGNLLKTSAWADVQNKPTFATVATSGSYTDLTNKPPVLIEAAVPDTLNGSTGDLHGMVAYDGTNLYFCTADYTDGVAEIWKTIPWDGGGAANTGDVTFDQIKIIGSGTASGDGAGYATLELVPDNSLYSNGQYLVIDPTAPSHIHIRAGGLQDQSPADLFLGGEKNHVRTRDNQGVRIQNIQTTDNFWYFVDTTDFTSGSWYTESGNHYVEFTTTNAEMVSKFWDFTNGGPNRVRLNDGDEIEYGGSGSNPTPNVYKVQVVAAPPSSPTSLTSIEFHIFVDNTNYLYLENNDFRVDVADDIRMFGRDVFRLANYSFEEPVEIQTDYDNQAWTWRFQPNGILDLPDGKTLNFGQGTIGAPVAGGGTDRVRLYDFQGGGSNFNYAIGVEGNHIWFSMDVNNGTGGYKFYSRDNQVFKIRDDGVLIFEDSSTFNVTAAPTTSKGQVGDKAGTVAFDATYMYYCKQNYAASSISVTALASAGTTVWIDSADYAGDLAADFTANSTGWTYNGVTITAVSADNTFGPGYALTGTTGFSVVNGNNYTLVSPNLPDIWKRVAWSNDTW